MILSGQSGDQFAERGRCAQPPGADTTKAVHLFFGQGEGGCHGLEADPLRLVLDLIETDVNRPICLRIGKLSQVVDDSRLLIGAWTNKL